MLISLSQVEVFGSYKTGLYLPTSDIDVSVHLFFFGGFSDNSYFILTVILFFFSTFGLYIKVVILESGITNPQLGLKALSRALSQRGIAKNILVFFFDFLL